MTVSFPVTRRAVDPVAASLVIDMLAPLKLRMAKDYAAHRLTDVEAAEFKASGITGLHNAYGLGGPDSKTDGKRAVAMGIQNAEQFETVEDVALFRRGYSNENIRAVLGGNFRRPLAQVWG